MEYPFFIFNNIIHYCFEFVNNFFKFFKIFLNPLCIAKS